MDRQCYLGHMKHLWNRIHGTQQTSGDNGYDADNMKAQTDFSLLNETQKQEANTNPRLTAKKIVGATEDIADKMEAQIAKKKSRRAVGGCPSPRCAPTDPYGQLGTVGPGKRCWKMEVPFACRRGYGNSAVRSLPSAEKESDLI